MCSCEYCFRWPSRWLSALRQRHTPTVPPARYGIPGYAQLNGILSNRSFDAQGGLWGGQLGYNLQTTIGNRLEHAFDTVHGLTGSTPTVTSH